MQEEKNVQIDVCNFLFRKALLESQLVDYLKNQGYIFKKVEYCLCENIVTYAIHPDYYKDWLENGTWKTYSSHAVIKLDS